MSFSSLMFRVLLGFRDGARGVATAAAPESGAGSSDVLAGGIFFPGAIGTLTVTRNYEIVIVVKGTGCPGSA